MHRINVPAWLVCPFGAAKAFIYHASLKRGLSVKPYWIPQDTHWLFSLMCFRIAFSFPRRCFWLDFDVSTSIAFELVALPFWCLIRRLACSSLICFLTRGTVERFPGVKWNMFHCTPGNSFHCTPYPTVLDSRPLEKVTPIKDFETFFVTWLGNFGTTYDLNS